MFWERNVRGCVFKEKRQAVRENQRQGQKRERDPSKSIYRILPGTNCLRDPRDPRDPSPTAARALAPGRG